MPIREAVVIVWGKTTLANSVKSASAGISKFADFKAYRVNT
jgi:hypothetical protein